MLKKMIAVALVAGATQAHAIEQTWWGLGNGTCEGWLKRETYDGDRGWALGYITAMSVQFSPQLKIDLLRNTTAEQVWGRIEGYCKANRKDTVQDAVIQVFIDIGQDEKRKAQRH